MGSKEHPISSRRLGSRGVHGTPYVCWDFGKSTGPSGTPQISGDHQEDLVSSENIPVCTGDQKGDTTVKETHVRLNPCDQIEEATLSRSAIGRKRKGLLPDDRVPKLDLSSF